MTRDETFAKYLLARILYWQETLDGFAADAVLDVLTIVEATRREVVQKLEDEAAGLLLLQDWRREQDEAFLAWSDEILAGARASISGTVSEASLAAATASLTACAAILSLDGRASMVKTVGLSTEQLRSWFQDTSLFGLGLDSVAENIFQRGFQNEVLSALRQSGILGEGTAAAVDRVLRTAADAGFEIDRRDAISITRTFIQTANVRAQEAVYDANKSLLKGYKRVETLDSRTCRSCALADGSTYGLDEPRPRLPAHPLCRGVWTVVAKSWRDFGFTVDDLDEVARPWTIRERGPVDVGGKKIENFGKTTEDFEGWWRSLSDKDKQRTSIGRVRQFLLESGQVTWAELWNKATGLPYTLRELGFDLQGNPLK